MTIQAKLAEAARVLQEATTIALVSHTGPDSDAYGSMCGLALLLNQAGKIATCYNEFGAMEKYRAIPGVEAVVGELPKALEVDLLVVCDCGDAKRIGDEFGPTLLSAGVKLLNIDHHVSNDGFGDFNLVSDRASSTAEIVFRLAKEAGFSMTADAATALLYGIVGDTGSFRYSCTSAETLEIAAELVRAGASLHQVSQELYGTYPLSLVKLQAHVLLNMKLSAEGQIAGVAVDRATFAQYGASVDDADMLVERARDIQGVKISYAARETDELWKVSLRSVGDHLDISQVAASFGGGGHRAAAAFRTRKPFSEIEPSLISRLEEVLREHSA